MRTLFRVTLIATYGLIGAILTMAIGIPTGTAQFDPSAEIVSNTNQTSIRPIEIIDYAKDGRLKVNSSPQPDTRYAPDDCPDLNEPNDTYATATDIQYGDTFIGLGICDVGDTDYFKFVGTAGDVIAIDIDASEIGSPLDSFVTLYDTDGTSELATNDDQSDTNLDSFLAFTLDANGTYYFEVKDFDYPDTGGPDYTYNLSFYLAGSDVGPLIHDNNIIEDPIGVGSANDNDGIPECGENISLFVELLNQGADPAAGVSATLSTSDPYISWLFLPSSDYPSAPPGGIVTSFDDYYFSIDSLLPDGHIAQFDINITADNGGPWTDTFDLVIGCEATAYDNFIYLPLVAKNLSTCNDSNEPNNTTGEATSISYGETIQDADICPMDDQDYYSFNGHAGDVIEANVSLSGSALSPALVLFDTNGISELTSGTTQVGYTLPADGTYYLRVRDTNYPNEGGQQYTYDLSLDIVGSSDTWTFMVYLDGDNEMETNAIDNFLEMSSVGSSDDINILVQFDRIAGYDSRFDDWTSTKRFYVTSGMNPTATNALTDLGEINMGNPLSLIDFVQWGKHIYPAEHYAIILWDHGNGWQVHTSDLDPIPVTDVIYDDTSGDALDMPELRTAMLTVSNAGGSPIDLVGFDASLMGMIEVDNQLLNFVDVRVGSEDSVPTSGWPYDTILSSLVISSTMTASEFGTEIVDEYYASYGSDEIMSAVDLGNLYDTLNSAVDALALALVNGVDTHFDDIASARAGTQSFDNPDYIDLYDFAAQINLNVTDTPINTAASAVQTALSNAIIHEQHGASWPGAYGISIYYPAIADFYDYKYDGSQSWLEFTEDFNWDEWLNAYYDQSTSGLPINGDFEQVPNTSWVEYSSQYGYPLITFTGSLPPTIQPRSGVYVAWLGGLDDETAYISQTVTIPPEYTTLSFWYQIDSEETCGSNYDTGSVLINGTQEWIIELCTGNNTTSWQYTSIDLSAYSGSAVTLQLQAITDLPENGRSIISSFFIDDVQLVAPISPLILPIITPQSNQADHQPRDAYDKRDYLNP